MEIRIREAVREDLLRFTEIYNMAIRSRHCTGHTDEFTAKEREAWLLSHFENPRYPLLAAETDGKVIGYIHLSPYIDRQAFMDDAEITYYVDFEYHGMGVGSAMMEAMLRKARELGFEHIIGTLLSINEPSIALLQKFGFEKWGCLPDIMNMGNGVRCDFLIYGLRLAKSLDK